MTNATKPELVSLANALQGDPDLAYQYVHDNVATIPVKGSLKGPIGAFLDARATALDQAELMALVLQVKGVSATVEYGTRAFSQAEMTSWLGVSDPGAIPNILSAGGFANAYTNLEWAWVKVVANGQTTYFDPAAKMYTPNSGLGPGTAAVEGAFGISPAQLKTDAEVGASIVQFSPTSGAPGTIQNLSYINASNPQNGSVQRDLTNWANSMVQKVRSLYPNSSTADITGDNTIVLVPLLATGAHYGQASEIGSVTGSFNPNTPSTNLPLRQRLSLGFGSQTPKTFASSDLYGRLLYVYFNSGNGSTTTAPELWLEGQQKSATDATPAPVQIGTAINRGGPSVSNLSFKVCYPGSTASVEDYSGSLTFRNPVPGIVFTILNQWGPVGRGMVERQRRLLEASRGAAAQQPVPAAGDRYEPLVRSLTVLGFTWGAQRTQLIDILNRASETITGENNVIGVAGLTPSGTQYTPYFDIAYRQNIFPPLSQTAVNANKSIAAANLVTLAGSMLESSVLQQTQPGLQAVSASKLLGLASQARLSQSTVIYDINNNPSNPNDVPQQTTNCQKNWNYYVNTLRPILVQNGYLATDLATFDQRVGGGKLTAPASNLLNGPGTYSNKCAFDSTGAALEPYSDGRLVLPKPGNLTLGNWPDAVSATAYGLSGSTYLIFGQALQASPLLNDANYTGLAGTYLSGGLDNGAGASCTGLITGEPGACSGQAQGGGVAATAVNPSGSDNPGGGSIVTSTAGSGAAGVGVAPGNALPGDAGLNANTAVTDNASPADPSQSVPGGNAGRGGAANQQGNFTYAATDISVGNGGFPYQLTLSRSYDSNLFRQSGPFPVTGWTHNFIQRALEDNDMFEALGTNSPINGASGIVTLYAALDLLSQGDARTPSAENVLIVTMMINWLSEEMVAKNVVTVATPGASERFVRLADGTYGRPLHSSSSLTKNANPANPPAAPHNQVACPAGTLYQYLSKGQALTCFNTQGNVTQWSNPTGMSVNWLYDNTGRPTKVSNNIGRSLAFGYDPNTGKLSYASDNLGLNVAHNVGYTRDSNSGNFVVTLPNGEQASYGFDQFGRMVTVIPPTFTTAQPETTVYYDVIDRVGVLTDALGHATSVFPTGSRTEIVDAVGNSSVALYDPRGNLIGSIDGLNYSTSFTYDGRSRLASQTLPEGNSFAYTYDDRDNLLRENDTPKSGSGLAARSALFTYDPVFNRTTVAQDFDGRTTQWNISSTTGLITAEIDQAPLSSTPAVTSCLGQSSNAPTTCLSYNGIGKLTQVTDPIGKVTKFAYDPTNYDLATSTLDVGASPHLNIATTYDFDKVGNLSSVSDPYTKTTSYTYDNDRRLTSVDIPYNTSIGSVRRPMTIGRDVYGRVLCTRWQTNTAIPPYSSNCATTGTATGAAQTTATDYTATGQVKTRTDASGRVVTYGYDTADRPLYAQDASGQIVSWSYDHDGRIAQICQGKATIAPLAPCAGQKVMEKLNYTANNLLRGRQHFSAGAWHQTTYLPDGYDRPGAQVSYPDGNKDLRTWSAAGDLKTFTPRVGTATTYTYDALHRPISRSGSWSASYTYDLASHPFSVAVNTAADGVAAGTWYWGYDSAGRLISEVQPNISTLPVRYKLDLNGLRDSTFWPDGAEYYLADNYNYVRIRGELTPPGQNTATPIWTSFPDPFNQPVLVKLLPSSGTIYAARAYDNAGGGLDVVKVTNTPVTGANFDYRYGYDAAHRLLTQTTYGTAPVPHPTAANTLDGLTANSSNQVLNAVPGHTLSYEPGANGNPTGNLTSDGVRSYTYAADGTGRMLSASMGTTSASYSYDPFGRRIAKTVGGVTTRFLFDAAGREIGEYDSSKNLLRRLLWHPDFTAPLAFASAAGALTFQLTDRLGSVTATLSSTGTTTNSYGYLPYGDTPSGTLSGTAFGYAGYRYDSETGTYHTATRNYDPRLGRFLQTDPIGQQGGTNIYAYASGNPLGGTDPSGLAPGDGAFRDGSQGTSLGGSQASGGVGATNNPGSGACACQGSSEHERNQDYNNRVVAYDQGPQLTPAPVLTENLPPPPGAVQAPDYSLVLSLNPAVVAPSLVKNAAFTEDPSYSYPVVLSTLLTPEGIAQIQLKHGYNIHNDKSAFLPEFSTPQGLNTLASYANENGVDNARGFPPGSNGFAVGVSYPDIVGVDKYSGPTNRYVVYTSPAVPIAPGEYVRTITNMFPRASGF